MKKIFLTLTLVLALFNLMLASDGPQVWTLSTATTSGVFNNAIVINPTTPAIMYAGTAGAGVYKTTDGGTTWVQSNVGLTNLNVQTLGISPSSPSTIYAGGTTGIFKSTDSGANWALFSTGITQTPPQIQGIAVSPTDPNTVVICVWDGVATLDASIGVFKTTNGGTLWAASNTGIGANKNVLSLMVNPLKPNTLYAGTSFYNPGGTATGPCYVYKSYDFGNNWVNSSNGFGTATTDQDPIRQLAYSTIDTVTILAGRFWNTSNGGPWVTTDAGATWVQKNGGIVPAAFPGSLIRSCAIRPGTSNEFVFGGDATTQAPGGVWRTTNGGTNWLDFNGAPLLSTYVIRSLKYGPTNNTLYAGVAGTIGFGVYEYTFFPLGVSGQENGTPREFALKQNYPNPFNPTTTLEYSIPTQSLVSIKVFDMLGREVQTLVNETKNAGSYVVNFNASSLPSGAYFCKIVAGNFSDTKKMILVK
jgi:photosystem II stability/assembly factor-like uncharacterized protein